MFFFQFNGQFILPGSTVKDDHGTSAKILRQADYTTLYFDFGLAVSMGKLGG